MGTRTEEKAVRTLSHRLTDHSPIGRSRQQSHSLDRDRIGNKLVDGMRNKHVGVLDPAPQIVPDLGLRRAGNVNEVTADFDVGSIEDGDAWADFSNEGDQTRHLRVIDEDYVGASWGLREGVSERMLDDDSMREQMRTKGPPSDNQ